MSGSREKPAVIRFGKEDENSSPEYEGGSFPIDTDFEDEESIEEIDLPKKKKRGLPGWVIVFLAVLFFVVIGAAGLIFVKKRNAAALSRNEIVSVIPQPSITAPQQLSALEPSLQNEQSAHSAVTAGVVPVTGATIIPQPFPAEKSGMPAVDIALSVPTSVPSSAPVPAPTSSPVPELTGKEVIELINAVDQLQKRLEKLESTVQNQRVVPSASPVIKAVEKPAVVAPAVVAPVKTAVKSRQVPAKKATVEKVIKRSAETETIVSPLVRRDYSISAIVNNRAFVIKKNADGTESELSVVPGDKIDGKEVLQVDGREKMIVLEGAQRITANRLSK